MESIMSGDWWCCRDVSSASAVVVLSLGVVGRYRLLRWLEDGSCSGCRLESHRTMYCTDRSNPGCYCTAYDEDSTPVR